MSDNEEMSLDDEFGRMAEQAEAAEAEKASRKGSGKGSFQFDTVKWTGLEPKKMKILRCLGKGPALGLVPGQKPVTPFDARVVRLARVIDDKGKQMKLVLPRREDDENHIMWRIIDRINEVDWVPALDDKGNPIPDPKDPKRTKNVKVFVNEKRHPDVFNIVNFSNLPESDPQRKFGLLGKGWEGREVLVMNVIDRSMMDWHRKNKHTVLLAKNINVRKNPDGSVSEFVDEGVPSYGFSELLNGIIRTYKYWGKYDIGIERTGSTNPPYRVHNVSRTPEVASKELQALICNDPNTPEEEGWERYNIDKIYGVTNYTKLWERLHLSIEMIDAKMGTKYAPELKNLSDMETLERLAKRAEEAEANNDPEMEAANEDNAQAEKAEEPEEEVIERKPVTPPAASGSDGLDKTSLPGWSALDEKERKGILDVVSIGNDDTPSVVKYSPEYKKMAKCPTCKTKAPVEYAICPGCGMSFVF